MYMQMLVWEFHEVMAVIADNMDMEDLLDYLLVLLQGYKEFHKHAGRYKQ